MNPRHALLALQAVTSREVAKFVRQGGRLASALVRPMLWLVVFAAGFQNVFGVSIIPPYDTYIPYQTYIVPGLLGMVLLFNGMQSSLAMVYDREMGVMRLLLTAPLPRAYLLFAKLLAGTLLSVLQAYTFLAIVGLGTPIVWTLLNIPLLAARGQTGGQYVAGLRLVRENGAPLTVANAAAWWFCFNPLLFSWPMAFTGGLPMSAIIAIVLGSWTIAVFTLLIVLCIILPFVALISAALDHRNRTLHDRIVGTIVVPIE